MKNIFQKASSTWVKYSEYILKKGADGLVYIKPAPKAMPQLIDPLENPEAMVIDALNVGMLIMGKKSDNEIKAAVLKFVSNYGLFGFMTALPTTPNFMDYDAVYLPKNHFIKAESMGVEEYANIFFPFEKPEFRKTSDGSTFSVGGDRENNDMKALMMTFSNEPMAMNMSFQREYAENYEWLLTQFKDWAFVFLTSFIYYDEYEQSDETTRNLYRRGMSAFGGIAPTYRIGLLDKPTIIWDFQSLLIAIQMMFSFMLTDEDNPLLMCKHCKKAFVAEHPNAMFCSPRCEKQFKAQNQGEK